MNNNYNPWAQPFTPNYGYPDQPSVQNRYRGQWQSHAHGYMPPASVANASQNASYGQPQQYYSHSPGPCDNNNTAALQQAQAQAYYYQWAQFYGYTQGFTPINAPQRSFGQTPQRNYPFFAPSYAAVQTQPALQGISNQDLQYAFDKLYKDVKTRTHRTNLSRRASSPLSDDEPIHVTTDGPVKAKEDLAAYPTTAPTGRSREAKIMLPAPKPTEAYMAQAAAEPSTVELSGRILVILDLNGTLLYRPSKNKKTMIARPFLTPFLRYLFSNFAVMVWSSARPDNVAALVEQSLEKNLRESLVAQWARDAFNLKPEYYNRNVQVYKNLELVWAKDEIQQQHPDYENGGRFGQHNTVLIDDTILKAAAQPHNLLQISEFSATPQQMRENNLREVAGYLDFLRTQQDVSKFMKREPFQHASDKWTYEWPEQDVLVHGSAHEGGELQGKVSMQSPSKKPKKPKKNKKAKQREVAAEKAAQAGEKGREQTPQSEDSGDEGEAERSDGGVRLF